MNVGANAIDAAVTAQDDAQAAYLQVNGTTVTGFAQGTTTYSIVLPAGTTIASNVTATVYDTGRANVVATLATVLPGETSVLVTAQDDTATGTYTVNYDVQTAFGFKPCSQAGLFCCNCSA